MMRRKENEGIMAKKKSSMVKEKIDPFRPRYDLTRVCEVCEHAEGKHEWRDGAPAKRCMTDGCSCLHGRWRPEPVFVDDLQKDFVQRAIDRGDLIEIPDGGEVVIVDTFGGSKSMKDLKAEADRENVLRQASLGSPLEVAHEPFLREGDLILKRYQREMSRELTDAEYAESLQKLAEISIREKKLVDANDVTRRALKDAEKGVEAERLSVVGELDAGATRPVDVANVWNAADPENIRVTVTEAGLEILGNVVEERRPTDQERKEIFPHAARPEEISGPKEAEVLEFQKHVSEIAEPVPVDEFPDALDHSVGGSAEIDEQAERDDADPEEDDDEDDEIGAPLQDDAPGFDDPGTGNPCSCGHRASKHDEMGCEGCECEAFALEGVR